MLRRAATSCRASHSQASFSVMDIDGGSAGARRDWGPGADMSVSSRETSPMVSPPPIVLPDRDACQIIRPLPSRSTGDAQTRGVAPPRDGVVDEGAHGPGG